MSFSQKRFLLWRRSQRHRLRQTEARHSDVASCTLAGLTRAWDFSLAIRCWP